MSERMWIRSHVERLLEQVWGGPCPAPDADGDYFFREGTAACWVGVLDTRPIMVRVFAHAAIGVRSSLALFKELNDIERRALSASVVLEDDTVVVSQTLSPVGLTAPVLDQALICVGGVADDIGLLVASMFGGATPFGPLPAPLNEDAS